MVAFKSGQNGIVARHMLGQLRTASLGIAGRLNDRSVTSTVKTQLKIPENASRLQRGR